MNETCPIGCLIVSDATDKKPWTALILDKWYWGYENHQLMADAVVWDREGQLHQTIKRWCLPCFNRDNPKMPIHPSNGVSFWRVIRIEDQDD